MDLHSLQPLDALTASWLLQFVLGAVVTTALFVMAVTFRRSGMQALALGWLAYAILLGSETLLVYQMRAEGSLTSITVLGSVVLVAQALMLATWSPVAAALAGERVRALPTRRVVASWVAVALGLIVVSLVADFVSGRNLRWIDNVIPRFSYALIFVPLAIDALRRARNATHNRVMLEWLAFGYALYIVRLALNLSLEPLGRVGGSAELFIAGVQLLHISSFGIISLLAAAAFERTAMFAQAQRLAATEAMLHADERFRSLGRLAAGVAHDSNNIFTAIRASIEMAEEDPTASPSVREELAAGRDSLERAEALSSRLLTFARAQPTVEVPMAVCERVQSCLPLLQRLVPASTTLDVRPDPHCGLIKIDPTQFDQVLLNLVVNASEALSGAGRVIVGAHREEVVTARQLVASRIEPGTYVVLRVADNGSGIPPEMLRQVFEPFFTTKSTAGGSGLGLATVWGAVQQSNGHVHVESTPGAGTDFLVYWPLAGESAGA